mmetsp:Transcript_5951/g.15150  ORF Transcript_5951/g.15150 Transcript_5951/m.15150 type:complete len:637 (-) Transcript_5951:198-2108(-)
MFGDGSLQRRLKSDPSPSLCLQFGFELFPDGTHELHQTLAPRALAGENVGLERLPATLSRRQPMLVVDATLGIVVLNDTETLRLRFERRASHDDLRLMRGAALHPLALQGPGNPFPRLRLAFQLERRNLAVRGKLQGERLLLLGHAPQIRLEAGVHVFDGVEGSAHVLLNDLASRVQGYGAGVKLRDRGIQGYSAGLERSDPIAELVCACRVCIENVVMLEPKRSGGVVSFGDGCHCSCEPLRHFAFKSSSRGIRARCPHHQLVYALLTRFEPEGVPRHALLNMVQALVHGWAVLLGQLSEQVVVFSHSGVGVGPRGVQLMTHGIRLSLRSLQASALRGVCLSSHERVYLCALCRDPHCQCHALCRLAIDRLPHVVLHVVFPDHGRVPLSHQRCVPVASVGGSRRRRAADVLLKAPSERPAVLRLGGGAGVCAHQGCLERGPSALLFAQRGSQLVHRRLEPQALIISYCTLGGALLPLLVQPPLQDAGDAPSLLSRQVAHNCLRIGDAFGKDLFHDIVRPLCGGGGGGGEGKAGGGGGGCGGGGGVHKVGASSHKGTTTATTNNNSFTASAAHAGVKRPTAALAVVPKDAGGLAAKRPKHAPFGAGIYHQRPKGEEISDAADILQFVSGGNTGVSV